MIGHPNRRRATQTLSLPLAPAVAGPLLHAIDPFGDPQAHPVPAEVPSRSTLPRRPWNSSIGIRGAPGTRRPRVPILRTSP